MQTSPSPLTHTVVSTVIFVFCFQRSWDSSIVFLFDKSLTKYSGPLTARPLPDSVNFIGEIYNCILSCADLWRVSLGLQSKIKVFFSFFT